MPLLLRIMFPTFIKARREELKCERNPKTTEAVHDAGGLRALTSMIVKHNNRVTATCGTPANLIDFQLSRVFVEYRL